MKLGNNKWLDTNVQAHIDPPPISLIRSTTEKVEECNIIKINMRRDPAPATFDTYELKVPTFENGKPEESLQMIKDFKTATDGTETTSTTRKIQFLRTMLCREALI